jgi:GTPase
MTEFYEPNQQEKAYLVGVTVKGSRPLLSVQESLKELALLADTAGMMVTGQASQTVGHIDASTFIGSGKVEEVKEEMINLETNILIFDDELSPRHQRELERRFGESVKIIDRSTLILDIFAQHARTREGALQVELAQYEYRLPRLTRQWTHLARQAGGSGTKAGVGLRGPGETQLEVDKREIGRKISKLKEEIELVRMHRSQHRKQRTKAGVPVIALVGYTNAGKSTLLKAITGADVYIRPIFRHPRPHHTPIHTPVQSASFIIRYSRVHPEIANNANYRLPRYTRRNRRSRFDSACGRYITP